MRASISEIEPATAGVADGRPALSTRTVLPETARATGCRKPNLAPEMVRMAAPLLARTSLSEPASLATKRSGPALVIAVGWLKP